MEMEKAKIFSQEEIPLAQTGPSGPAEEAGLMVVVVQGTPSWREGTRGPLIQSRFLVNHAYESEMKEEAP